MKKSAGRVRMDPEARKLQLLNVAVDMALKRGLDNVTRDDVSSNAKVSVALISYYFANTRIMKQEVIQCAIEREIIPLIAQALSIKLVQPEWINTTLKQKVVSYMVN